MENTSTLYYQFLPTDGKKINVNPDKTALLIVDMQHQFISRDGLDAQVAREKGMFDQWEYFFNRIDNLTIPNNKKLLDFFRTNKLEVTFGRIACHHKDGRDRSPVQRRPGWNNILLPIGDPGAEMVDELKPLDDEIVVNKTTDSVLSGTNYEFLLRNMGIETVVCTGVVTDQCVASTVRSLADAGFEVILVEDACAAATQQLHDAEIMIMNQIYCQVMSTDEVIDLVTEELSKTKLVNV
ncbi:cysteine hydrolase family protein [Paenibacillus albiflavus]|uniref:Cysteine hydrolase family protein n=1 Tax=Paenibacillus albiflavus TaxID=2545760 RepID=A0A4R4EBN6_9BACL|nr:cysteine hydrolase family protein [Paenibacillus albiflavus]TCZ76543.1 cysteine hydrolase family protein [Paenibacillus albiflavus]